MDESLMRFFISNWVYLQKMSMEQVSLQDELIFQMLRRIFLMKLLKSYKTF